MQPQSLKLTIKLKSEKLVDNSLTTTNHLSAVEGKTIASNDTNRPGSVAINSQDQVDLISAGGVENHHTEDEENLSKSSHYQLVPCDRSVNGTVTDTVQDPIGDRPSLTRQQPRVLPSIGAFTVQCANCLKWRLIPTKEKYEEIREHIIELPFFCETAQEWRPNISCDDPPDITQDGSRVWAIDKPNIAQPPPGWQRLLKFRGEGSSKFADVYYVAPAGKRLRSLVEIQRYLNEHPEYAEEGVNLSQFSFQIPRPLHDNYVRKRPARVAPSTDANNHDMLISPHPTEAQPISWIRPDVEPDFQHHGSWPSSDHTQSPDLNPEAQSTKKRKASS